MVPFFIFINCEIQEKAGSHAIPFIDGLLCAKKGVKCFQMLPHLSWSYRQAKEGVKRWSFSPSWKVAESFTDLPLLKMTLCNSLKTNFLGAMCRFSVDLCPDRQEQWSSYSFFRGTTAFETGTGIQWCPVPYLVPVNVSLSLWLG